MDNLNDMASLLGYQGHHEGTTFDSLPDELLLKIVKMAAQTNLRDFYKHKYDYKFLLGIIGKISIRFKNIATDKTFWGGYILMRDRPGYSQEYKLPDLSEEDINTLVTDFLCEDSKFLHLKNLRKKLVDGRWTPVDGEIVRSETIRALSHKCPKLIDLGLSGLRLERWPDNTWNSLESLFLGASQLHFDVFGNAQLHQYLPNLKFLLLDRCESFGGEPITLPDVSECKSLHLFEIRNGIYRFPTDLDEKVPFPRSLKRWVFWPERIYDVRGQEFDKNTSRYHVYLMYLMRDHMKDCEISAWLQDNNT